MVPLNVRLLLVDTGRQVDFHWCLLDWVHHTCPATLLAICFTRGRIPQTTTSAKLLQRIRTPWHFCTNQKKRSEFGLGLEDLFIYLFHGVRHIVHNSHCQCVMNPPKAVSLLLTTSVYWNIRNFHNCCYKQNQQSIMKEIILQQWTKYPWLWFTSPLLEHHLKPFHYFSDVCDIHWKETRADACNLWCVD